MRFPSVALLAPSLFAVSCTAGRFIMYYDEWHSIRPTTAADREGIDHVVLSFAMANNTAGYQPKVPISTIRSEFPNAKIMIAVGGWGDTVGFSQAAKTSEGIAKFANDVQTMLQTTGADGVDIDWEYPGGNGADYKVVVNSEKAYEIGAFPKLLAATREAIGKDKLLSIAVPGKEVDMIAYTSETGPLIWPTVDYINVMSYDLMNRRDTHTAHHTSVAGAADAIERYMKIGAPVDKINLGFAFYAKYFQTQGDCSSQPLGCPIVEAEDPVTGEDTLTSGAWTFEKGHLTPIDESKITVSWDGTCGPEKMTKCASGCCSAYGFCGTAKDFCSGGCQHAFGTGCTDPDVFGSWQTASANGGMTDKQAGGQYFFDPTERLFWTWDTPELIAHKFEKIVKTYGLGGVMAWSLGEDSYDWSHIKRIASELKSGSYESSPGASKSLYPQEEYETEVPTKTEDAPQATPNSDDPDDIEYCDDDGWCYYYAYADAAEPVSEPEYSFASEAEPASAPESASVSEPEVEPEVYSDNQAVDYQGDVDDPEQADSYDWNEASEKTDAQADYAFAHEANAMAEEDYDYYDESQGDDGYSSW